MKAFNDLITSWPARLVATCLFVALAVYAYVLYRKAVSPAREALGAAIFAASIFAVLPLLTTNVMVAHAMYMCLAGTWVYVFFRHVLLRLGGLFDGAVLLMHPGRWRERIAARRRSLRRGARLEQSLQAALHEREAPPR